MKDRKMTILKNKITGKYFERGKCFSSPRRCASKLTSPEVAFVRATFDPTHIEEEDADDGITDKFEQWKVGVGFNG